MLRAYAMLQPALIGRNSKCSSNYGLDSAEFEHWAQFGQSSEPYILLQNLAPCNK